MRELHLSVRVWFQMIAPHTLYPPRVLTGVVFCRWGCTPVARWGADCAKTDIVQRETVLKRTLYRENLQKKCPFHQSLSPICLPCPLGRTEEEEIQRAIQLSAMEVDNTTASASGENTDVGDMLQVWVLTSGY